MLKEVLGDVSLLVEFERIQAMSKLLETPNTGRQTLVVPYDSAKYVGATAVAAHTAVTVGKQTHQPESDYGVQTL